MEPREGAAFDPPARFERAGGFQFVEGSLAPCGARGPGGPRSVCSLRVLNAREVSRALPSAPT